MSPTVFLGLVSGSLFVVFVVMAILSVGVSASGKRSDRTREHTREAVRNELFERQGKPEPEWEGWIESMSATEREALVSVLDRYLRVVEGEQRETFLEIAMALNLGENSESTLDRDAVVPRLRALATLAMLEHPLSIDRLLETCTDTQRTREAAARLLYERREEYAEAAEWGTKLIVWEGTEPITIYGLDTLAELNTGSETPLLALADEAATSWDRSVLVQVCLVLEGTEQIDSEAPVGWLFSLLEHERPEIRTAAVRAFKHQGWRESIRERIDLRALLADDSEHVRQATYEVLTNWGDEEAREYLEWAALTEPDKRCQLIAVRGLVSLGIEQPAERPVWPERAWDWIQAELSISDRRRLDTSDESEGPQ